MANRLVNNRYGGFYRASGVVNGVGYIYDKQGAYEAGVIDHTLTAYALVYILEGGGTYHDAENPPRPVDVGDVILLFPGLVHTYHRTDTSIVWSEVFIEFQGEIFEALERDSTLSRQHPILSPGLRPDLVALVDDLVRDYQKAQTGDELDFSARTLFLLSRMLQAHRERVGQDAASTFVQEACARLQEGLERPVSVGDVAKTFGMNQKAFAHRFSEAVGVAPARYRMLQRIAAARTLLRDPTLAIKEIAARLGYCNTQFFSRQFKEITGASPAQHRSREVPIPTKTR